MKTWKKTTRKVDERNKLPIKWFKITFGIKKDFPMRAWIEKSMSDTVSRLIALYINGVINPLSRDIKFGVDNPVQQTPIIATGMENAKKDKDKIQKLVKIEWEKD